MSGLQHAKSFHNLMVYQKGRQLQREIFIITKSFPKEEVFSLTDQIRRSSRSIGANIVEAWAKRRYEKYFISKLTDSNGEQMETQHWVETALESGYIDTKTSAPLIEKCNRADTEWHDRQSRLVLRRTHTHDAGETHRIFHKLHRRRH